MVARLVPDRCKDAEALALSRAGSGVGSRLRATWAQAHTPSRIRDRTCCICFDHETLQSLWLLF